jgi:tetratricopeptide (TPR) repeat protein
MQKGIYWYQRGCYQRALEHFLRAHERFSALDQVPAVAMSLNNIGNVYRALGDTDRGLQFFDAAIDLYQNFDQHPEAVQILTNKAATLIDAQRLKEADDVLTKAEKTSAVQRLSYTPLGTIRGLYWIKLGAHAKAEAILQKTLAQHPPDDLPNAATLNYVMGTLMVQTSRLEEALIFYQTALAADRKIGFHQGIAEDLAAIGQVYFQQQRFVPAGHYLARSMKIFALLEDDRNLQRLQPILDKAAARAAQHTTLTEHFIREWSQGRSLENPCR